MLVSRFVTARSIRGALRHAVYPRKTDPLELDHIVYTHVTELGFGPPLDIPFHRSQSNWNTLFWNPVDHRNALFTYGVDVVAGELEPSS